MFKWLLIGVWLLPLLLALVLMPLAPLMVRPDPFVWPVVFLGLFARDRYAVAYVGLLGLLRDVFTAGPFGISVLIYAIVFRMVHVNRHRVYRQSFVVQASMTFLAAIAAGALEALAHTASGAVIAPLDAAWIATALAIPTALLAPWAYGAYAMALHRTGNTPNAVGDYAI